MNIGKKRAFDMFFIVVSAITLTILIEFDLIEKYIGYGLIPLFIAYQLGKYAERKFKD